MADERLEQFLTECALAWTMIPLDRHFKLTNAWDTPYGNFPHWLRYGEGVKAQFEYSHEWAETFAVVPFLGNVAGPHSVNKPGPRKSAYECRGDGRLPDLSAFAETDFFIVPTDFRWTMIHTHEDYAIGGPFFIREVWLGPPVKRRGKSRRL